MGLAAIVMAGGLLRAKPSVGVALARGGGGGGGRGGGGGMRGGGGGMRGELWRGTAAADSAVQVLPAAGSHVVADSHVVVRRSAAVVPSPRVAVVGADVAGIAVGAVCGGGRGWGWDRWSGGWGGRGSGGGWGWGGLGYPYGCLCLRLSLLLGLPLRRLRDTAAATVTRLITAATTASTTRATATRTPTLARVIRRNRITETRATERLLITPVILGNQSGYSYGAPNPYVLPPATNFSTGFSFSTTSF